MKDRKLLVFGSVVVVALLVVVASLALTFGERRRAERIVSVMQQIQVESDSRDHVIKATGSFERNADVEPPSGDQLGFVFNNRWLHYLRLASHVEFRAVITFKNGVVVDKRAWEIVSSTGCSAEIVESKRGFAIPVGFPVPANHHVVMWPDTSGRYVTRIQVQNDDTYPEDSRRADWHFDLSCMTRLGSGCRDARVMLPGAASQ